MKRLLIATGLALAAATVHAQEGPAPSAPATSQQQSESRVAVSDRSDTLHRGSHRYPNKERGKHAGDPPVIDHSMDTLLVEPTHSSIIILTPTPP